MLSEPVSTGRRAAEGLWMVYDAMLSKSANFVSVWEMGIGVAV
jgi:hypothetical protein